MTGRPDDSNEQYGYAPAADPAGEGFQFEEHRGRSSRRRLWGCLIPLVLVALIAFGGYQAYLHLENTFGGEKCKVNAGGHDETWEPEQAANASTIAAVGRLREDLPERAVHIAITTAIQESKLRNLTYGDRDSLGLFQQRPSQGWGTQEQILDPVYAATKFYQALVKVDGWQTRPVNDVAQDVQGSGHPQAYRDHEDEGAGLASALAGDSAAAIGCRLEDASSGTPLPELAAKLRAQSGVTATAQDGALSVDATSTRTAWLVAGWAVTHAQSDGVTRVTVGDREWRRERGKDGWSWHPAKRSTDSDRQVRVEVAGA